MVSVFESDSFYRIRGFVQHKRPLIVHSADTALPTNQKPEDYQRNQSSVMGMKRVGYRAAAASLDAPRGAAQVSVLQLEDQIGRFVDVGVVAGNHYRHAGPINDLS
jgi:hypothetical protein